jgi:hypothetical protein
MATFYVLLFIIVCVVPYVDEKIYAKQTVNKQKIKTESKQNDFIELKKNRKGVFEV